MSLTFWDSNLFIYLIEQVSPFAEQVEQVVLQMRQERSQLVTSALTVCVRRLLNLYAKNAMI